MALLELKRFQDAIDSCDAYFKTGQRSGRSPRFARAGQSQTKRLRRRDRRLHAGLSLQPGSSTSARPPGLGLPGLRQLTHWPGATSRRPSGWIPRAATPTAGVGSALVALGHYREAVADAEESLRHGESEARFDLYCRPHPRPGRRISQQGIALLAAGPIWLSSANTGAAPSIFSTRPSSKPRSKSALGFGATSSRWTLPFRQSAASLTTLDWPRNTGREHGDTGRPEQEADQCC